MKNQSPCPYPDSYISGPPKASETDDVAGPTYYVPWGKEGGHLEGADDAFIEAVWNVPTGRRGDK